MRLAAGTIALSLALSACGSPEAPEAAETPIAQPTTTTALATPSGQPQTADAVRVVAEEEFETFASGDYGGAWDLWTAAGKKAITRTNYEKLNELCPDKAPGVPFQIKKIRLDANKTRATVRVQRLITVGSFTFIYEEGRWRFQPLKQAFALYELGGPRKIAAKLKATAEC